MSVPDAAKAFVRVPILVSCNLWIGRPVILCRRDEPEPRQRRWSGPGALGNFFDPFVNLHVVLIVVAITGSPRRARPLVQYLLTYVQYHRY